MVNASWAGWLIWTAMKMVPAATAAAPAALTSPLRVMFMAMLLVGPGGVPGGRPATSATLGGGVVTGHHHLM